MNSAKNGNFFQILTSNSCQIWCHKFCRLGPYLEKFFTRVTGFIRCSITTYCATINQWCNLKLDKSIVKLAANYCTSNNARMVFVCEKYAKRRNPWWIISYIRVLLFVIRAITFDPRKTTGISPLVSPFKSCRNTICYMPQVKYLK